MAASSETAPLLRQAAVAKANNQAAEGTFAAYDTIPAQDIRKDSLEISEPSWKNEAILLSRFSAPLVVTYVLQ